MNVLPEAVGYNISWQQERVWRLSQEAGEALQPLRSAVHIEGPLCRERLSLALSRLVSRHEILRTSFEMLAGMALPIQVVGAQTLGAGAWSSWSEGVPFAAQLVQAAPERHVLELWLSPLCADATSLNAIFVELAALYEGNDESLAEAPLQYADYAAWQDEIRAKDTGEGKRYWFGREAPQTPLGRLPLALGNTGHHHTGTCKLCTKVIPVELGPELAAGLIKLAAAKQLTVESVLLAAWAIVARHHLGDPGVTLGFLCDSRTTEITSAVGPYVRYLPFPVKLDGTETFSELAANLCQGAASHRDWQELYSGPSQGWEMGFGCNARVPVLRAGPVSMALEAYCPPPEPCCLHLQGLIGDGEICLQFYYDAGRLNAEAAACMAEQLVALLTGALREPDRAWQRLSLLGPGERSWIDRHHGKDGPAPDAAGLHELFERQARRVPHAFALRHANAGLTYEEVNRRAESLARALLEAGLEAEDRVGLFYRNPLHMVVAILAVLKAGGAYVPLDPSQPGERTAYILTDAAARFVLTEPALAASLSGFSGTVLLHDGADEACLPAARNCKAVRIWPEQLAYVIYTSGSSGLPKGVAISHGNALRSTLARHRVYPEPISGFLLLSAFSFDSSVAGLFWTLSQGGCLYLPQQAELRDPAALAALVERHRLSHLLCLPSLWDVLLEQGAAPLSSLRAAIAAGEPCPPGLPSRHARVLPDTRLYNEYGPTEGTVWATVHEIGREGGAARVPIGRPVEGVRIHILDSAGAEVPRGVTGEIYIGGGGVARGYHRSPGLTAASFVPDLFAREGSRLYRSGDLGRWRLDGTIDFLGRADQQIKIRGYRIELGEIESRLRLAPGVRDCAVEAREDRPGEKRLAAYVVISSEPLGNGGAEQHETSLERIRSYLSAVLPDYMIPSAWMVLHGLPRNANGKLDRARLPAPDGSGLRRPFVPPRSPVEKALAEIWQDLLQVTPIGIEDNFFELGGDSILSIQLAGRARQRGIILTARQMIEHQTIAGLAAVARHLSEIAAPALEPLGAASGGETPLTPIQHWFFDLGYSHPERWTHALLLDLREPLPAEVLEQAAAALLRYHEALRSRFHRDGSVWRQTVLPAAKEGAVTRIALPGLHEAEIRAGIEQRATCFLPVSIEDGRMLRLVLFERADGKPGHVLLVLHHLVADAVSWRVLIEDLNLACKQIRQGVPVQLPPVSTSFADWSRYLQARAADGSFAAEADFWQAELRQRAPRLRLDDPGGSRKEATSAVLTAVLDAAETGLLLHRAAPAFRAGVEDLLLTALALTLARCTGEGGGSVLIDLDRHGREPMACDLDLSRTIGWFTSVAPHLLTVDPAAPFLENLKSIKEQLRRVPQRGLGYGILRYLAPAATAPLLRNAAQSEIIFNYMGQQGPSFEPDSLFAIADGEILSGSDPEWDRPYELAINASILVGQLRITWEYGAGRWRQQTAESLLQDFQDNLRGLIAACAAPGAGGCTPSDFPLAALSQEQLDTLLGAACGIEDVYPLTPLQEGILFHSLNAPRSGVYVEHLSCILTGELSLSAFEAAWAQVLRAFPILRTRFLWQGLDAPLQAVQSGVSLPLAVQDWRSYPEAEQERLWAKQLEADLRQGFEFGKAPLMRLALAQRGDASWYFLWSHHHILLDGWSAPLVVKYVFDCYRALCAGNPPPLTHRPFRDYISFLSRRDRAAPEAFFRRYLAGFDEPTPLPFGCSRAAGGAGAGKDEAKQLETSLSLSEEATAKIEAIARHHKVTVNTVLQGALAVLLGRSSGRRDVLFGISVSGRSVPLPGIEEMAGLFINAMPLRVALPPAASIGDWLRGILARNAELRDHELTPLVEIQRWCEMPRGEAMFNVLFAFENYPVDAALREQQGPLTASNIHFTEQTHYPLTVVAFPGRALSVKFSADPACCDQTALQQLAEQLESILEGIASSPGGRVGGLSLLSEPERRQFVTGWSSTGTASPELTGTLAEVFAAQAARRPHAMAVVCEGVSLSYGDLNLRANRLARHLRGLGVRPEVLVGLCVERSLDMVVGILAIVKAGGAYLPLDPGSPKERLAFLISDAGAAVLLTQEKLLPALPKTAARIVCLDRDARSWAGLPGEDPVAASHAGNLAYVIYTSGSTGRPKGVMVTQRNVMRLFAVTAAEFGFGPQDVWTLFHSYAFDFSVWEMWGALLHGGRLVVVPSWVSRSPGPFYELLERERVTVLNQTPSAFQQLLAAEAFAVAQQDLALRLIIFGGEALDPGGLAPWFERYGDVHPRLVNMYGITETTVHVTQCTQSFAQVAEKSSVIGRPLADLRVYLLDCDLHPVPRGTVAGELFIGGPGLSRGYLGRPDLTAERYIPDPFGAAGERLYRTGDLARWRGDGTLEYLGRIDNQVKIRGYRIEPGEIEARLREHPAVREAAVVVSERTGRNPDSGESEDRSLAAYVVTESVSCVGGSPAGLAAAEIVGQWRAFFDDTYASSSRPIDPRFNIAGWISPYTGLAMTHAEMSEWVEHTAARIRALKPSKVLEIGCGTGLLLFRLAAECSRYVGTDLSARAIDSLANVIARSGPEFARVELLCRAADQFDAFEQGSFDTVVLNSVVQYFPSVDYLAAVLEGAARLVEPGGRIFVGDVRHLGLLEAFYLDVELQNAPSSMPVPFTARELLSRLQLRVQQEEELVIDPKFFAAIRTRLSRLGRVEIMLKRGQSRNEMTQFRYDAVLYFDTAQKRDCDVAWLDWSAEDLSVSKLRARLLNDKPDELLLCGVPNKRVAAVTHGVRCLASAANEAMDPAGSFTLAGWCNRWSEFEASSADPEEIWAIADDLPYDIELCWTRGGDDGRFEILCVRRDAACAERADRRLDLLSQTSTGPNCLLTAYANDPGKARAARMLIPQLRDHLREALPEYMIPGTFTILPALPLTQNGKIDRAALKSLGSNEGQPVSYAAPRNQTEEILVGVWAEVLGRSRVGIYDNFFELGGHSLLATQVISRLRKSFQIDLPLRRLFEAPTPAEMAVAVETALIELLGAISDEEAARLLHAADGGASVRDKDG
jgi:amino acid adenylation domain-containing protein/non-ribosomal peptide synthase protein (TIGR01720 family)